MPIPGKVQNSLQSGSCFLKPLSSSQLWSFFHCHMCSANGLFSALRAFSGVASSATLFLCNPGTEISSYSSVWCSFLLFLWIPFFRAVTGKSRQVKACFRSGHGLATRYDIFSSQSILCCFGSLGECGLFPYGVNVSSL